MFFVHQDKQQFICNGLQFIATPPHLLGVVAFDPAAYKQSIGGFYNTR